MYLLKGNKLHSFSGEKNRQKLLIGYVKIKLQVTTVKLWNDLKY
jgi:hypothetical protein